MNTICKPCSERLVVAWCDYVTNQIAQAFHSAQAMNSKSFFFRKENEVTKHMMEVMFMIFRMHYLNLPILHSMEK